MDCTNYAQWVIRKKKEDIMLRGDGFSGKNWESIGAVNMIIFLSND